MSSKRRKLEVNLPEDIFQYLEKRSKKENLEISELIVQMFEAKLKSNKDLDSTEKDNNFSSVALVKEGLAPLLQKSKNSVSNRQEQNEKIISTTSDIQLNLPSRKRLQSREQIKRKKQIEAEMKEVSLLIDTAESEEKRAEYSMRYALLASELNALL